MFFENLLYESYEKNISVLELRTSLNSIYKWVDKNGIYEKEKYCTDDKNTIDLIENFFLKLINHSLLEEIR